MRPFCSPGVMVTVAAATVKLCVIASVAILLSCQNSMFLALAKHVIRDNGNMWEYYPSVIPGLLQDDWIPMTADEATQYYTLHEICMLKSGTYNSDCEDFAGNLGECSVHAHGTGHSNAPCDNYAGAFFRHKSITTYPETLQIVDLIAAMKKRKSNTVVFYGDSVTRQHISDAQCSARRAGLKVAKLDVERCAHFRCNRESFEILDPFKAHAKPNSTDPPYFICYMVINEKPAGLEDVIKRVRTHNQVEGDVLFVVNMGLHYNLLPTDKKGFSYRAATHYIRDIDILFNALLEHALLLPSETSMARSNASQSRRSSGSSLNSRRSIVIFRETSAQHFPTKNRLYDGDRDNHKSRNLSKPIAPVSLSYLRLTENYRTTSHSLAAKAHKNCKAFTDQNTLAEHNWRNRIVYDRINQINPAYRNLIGLAPHFRVSAGRHDYHVKGGDCTHYCFGPMIWAPVWDYITKFYINSTRQQ